MSRWKHSVAVVAWLVAGGAVLAAGPGIESAVSVRSHEPGEYGLDVLAAVEPRAGGVMRLEVVFDTAIDPDSVAEHIEITDETGTAHTGFTWELAGAVLTVLPEPPLAEHCYTIDFAGLESAAGEVTDAVIEFIALEGDVTGDGIVNTVDYSSVKPWYGAAVDAETFLYDLTVSDPVVNGIDGSFVKPRFGNSVECPQKVTATHLAGNALGQYPWFEYVRAFNENATVEVAIDPARFPEIAGQTCDIHVVEAKAKADWEADPSLADVTPGGAQTQTFAGGTIQENTFTVAQPYDLSADAGTGLGVGYDVVLDCDQDGRLGPGDTIDGLGDEAGFYTVHDTTAPGPLAVSEAQYSGGSFWLTEITYYPSAIASMGELPLVTFSPGLGYHHTWYAHLGHHLASYGFIFMCHENNDGAGTEVASRVTIDNTDYIIGHQGIIQGGVLDGHIDTQRIVWLGHGRGAEGIVRAYDHLYDGSYPAEHFDVDDIVLLSAISPTDFLGSAASDPHGANFHLWTSASDAYIDGAPVSVIGWSFSLHDRATGFRQATILHGSGYGDFADLDGAHLATGPCLIGRENTHLIQKGLLLPLVLHYTERNLPAVDFFWRQWERFQPIGAPSLHCELTDSDAVVVTQTYQNGVAGAKSILDDYQSEPDPAVSSSGGAVSYSVAHVQEDLLADTDTLYQWTVADPLNGMLHARTTDTSRGVVFDWDSDAFYELEIVPAERDFTDDEYLSFRACQGTRHVNTTAVLEDLTFTVTLRDSAGATSSINIGAYGGGIEEPYQRDGYGVGAGWYNEFETVRIRLADFLANGSDLDLGDIVAVRFEFGPSHGSSEGRIGLDEIELVRDAFPW